MSHPTGPPARRAAGAVGLVVAALLAVAGGLLVTVSTSGAATAWVDPPIESPITTTDDASLAATPDSAPRRARSATLDRGVAGGTPSSAAGADGSAVPAPGAPPPGRSPPRR